MRKAPPLARACFLLELQLAGPFNNAAWIEIGYAIGEAERAHEIPEFFFFGIDAHLDMLTDGVHPEDSLLVAEYVFDRSESEAVTPSDRAFLTEWQAIHQQWRTRRSTTAMQEKPGDTADDSGSEARLRIMLLGSLVAIFRRLAPWWSPSSNARP